MLRQRYSTKENRRSRGSASRVSPQSPIASSYRAKRTLSISSKIRSRTTAQASLLTTPRASRSRCLAKALGPTKPRGSSRSALSPSQIPSGRPERRKPRMLRPEPLSSIKIFSYGILELLLVLDFYFALIVVMVILMILGTLAF